MSTRIQINDLFIVEEFVADYDKVPDNIRNKIDRIVDHVLTTGQFPNSFYPHRANAEKNVWIGYVNRKGMHWRILFDIDEYIGSVYLLRVIPHAEMDKILR